MKQGGFSAAVGSHQTEAVAAVQLYVKLVKDRGTARIAETNIFNINNQIVFFHSSTPNTRITAIIKTKVTMSFVLKENLLKL